MDTVLRSLPMNWEQNPRILPMWKLNQVLLLERKLPDNILPLKVDTEALLRVRVDITPSSSQELLKEDLLEAELHHSEPVLKEDHLAEPAREALMEEAAKGHPMGEPAKQELMEEPGKEEPVKVDLMEEPAKEGLMEEPVRVHHSEKLPKGDLVLEVLLMEDQHIVPLQELVMEPRLKRESSEAQPPVGKTTKILTTPGEHMVKLSHV